MGDLTLADLQQDADRSAALQALGRLMVHRRFLGEQDDAERAQREAIAFVERIEERARVQRVVVDGVDRGHVWLVAQGDDVSVLDVSLDDATLAADLRRVLLDQARADGFRRLTAGLTPGDLVALAIVEGGGFEVSATQMRLDLDHTLPAEDTVVLAPFDADHFAAFEADEVEGYAQAREKSGETRETALRISREQHAELLPDGLATPGHHFFVGRVAGQDVGSIWLGTERPMVFVYNVVVDEAHRRHGYGAGLMRAAALWSREQGSHALGLNVFGYNHGARALYDRLGYHVVEDFVARTL